MFSKKPKMTKKPLTVLTGEELETVLRDEELRNVAGGLGGGRSRQQDMASIRMLDLAVKSEDPLGGTFFLAAASV